MPNIQADVPTLFSPYFKGRNAAIANSYYVASINRVRASLEILLNPLQVMRA